MTTSRAKLTPEQKAAFLQTAYKNQGNKCYICLKAIDLDSQDPDSGPDLHNNPSLDHIDPKANLGEKAQHPDNWAASHLRCNQKKKTMGLDLARAIVWLEDIKRQHPQAFLSDVQSELKINPQRVRAVRDASDKRKLLLTFNDAPTITCNTYFDPKMPDCEYVYAQVPLNHIAHDSELAPRPLGDQIDRFIRGMFRQPILDVGHSRLETDEQGYGLIRLWNAQHRAVVALLTHRPTLDLKIYLNPTEEQLKALRSANADAHSSLRQVQSPAPNAAMRYATIFEDEWQAFRNNPNQPRISEKAFLASPPDAAAKKKFASILEKSVVIDGILRADDDPDLPLETKFKEVTEFTNTRSVKMLFTYNSLQKGFVSKFAHLAPLDVDLELLDPDDDPRRIERQNLVRLLNIIFEELLADKWQKGKGAKVQKDHGLYSEHNSAVMITRPVALQVWSEVLLEAIFASCKIVGSSYPKDSPENQKVKVLLLGISKDDVFLNRLPEQIWDSIRSMVRLVGAHQIWKNPSEQILAVLSSNAYGPAKLMLREGMIGEERLYEKPLNEAYLLIS